MDKMDKLFKSNPEENNPKKEINSGKEQFINHDGTVIFETPEEHAERMKQESGR